MTRSTVLIVTPEKTTSMQLDTRWLKWSKPAVATLSVTCAVLIAALATLGIKHLQTQNQITQAQQEHEKKIAELNQEVINLQNHTSAEVNAKLASLKKSEKVIDDLQSYLKERGVHIKPATDEPKKGKPNPAAGGPILTEQISKIRLGGNLQASVNDFTKDTSQLLAAIKSTPLGVPHTGSISSRFGVRSNPFTGRGSETHGGLDFRGNIGEPIKATANGTVSFAGTQNGYGKVIEIAHANGYKTIYAHLNKIEVTKGQKVQAGEKIGQLGSTGRSTGPHLHYEVQLKGQRLDPEDFLSLI